MINAELMLKLWEVFPDSFSVKKTVTLTEYKNGPWGQEEVVKGTSEEVLAEDILYTAQAYSRGGRDMKGAIEYLESFAPVRVQKQEIKLFYK